MRIRTTKIALALYILGFFTVTWDKILIWNFGGANFRISQLVFLLAFLAAAAGVRSRRELSFLKHPFFFAMAALGAYYLLGSPWSHYFRKSFLYSVWFFFNMGTIGLTAILLGQRGYFRQLLVGSIASLLFPALVIGVDQIAFQFGYVNGFIGYNQNEIVKWGISRPHAFAYEPSYIAVFLSFGLLYFFPSALSFAKQRPVLTALPTIIALFSLIATTSRTGWVGLALGTLVAFTLYVAKYRKVPLRATVAALGAGLLVVAVFLATTPAPQREALDKNLISSVPQGTDGSGIYRLATMKFAGIMAEKTHWLGTGMGASFKYWVDTVNSDETSRMGAFTEKSFGYEVVLSVWGQLLAEGGIPALLLYFIAAVSLLLTLVRRWFATGNLLVLGATAGAATWYLFTALLLGNVARGDIWVWFALWLCAAVMRIEDLGILELSDPKISA